MSTNPFRRSSIKPSPEFPSNAVSRDIPDTEGPSTPQLSIRTRVGSTQKHVNFASPPAIPISPASYPPSPDLTRLDTSSAARVPSLPSPTDYSLALQSDPFQAEAEAEPDEDDAAIQQALRNAKSNTSIAVPDLTKEKEDAVKNTLSRFASAPRRPAINVKPQDVAPLTVSNRQTMDVDAFKRLLLTGNSLPPESLSTKPDVGRTPSENDSKMDTLLQRSTSEHDRGIQGDSDTSSDSADEAERADDLRAATVTASGARRPPPPPQTRRGKSPKSRVKSHTSSDTSGPAAGVLSTPSTAAPENLADPTTAPKRPPTPPITRRRSQNSGVSRASLSRQSSVSSQENPVVVSNGNSKTPPPPPPPARRPTSIVERRASNELPITLEEADPDGEKTSSSSRTTDVRPPPPPSRNSSGKRTSLATPQSPVPPPPRRARGSSKSSVDSQRVTVAAAPTGIQIEPVRTSEENRRPEAEGWSSMSVSGANGILADLAALQKEVDEARRQAGN